MTSAASGEEADQRRPLLPQGFLVAAGMWVNRVPVWKMGVGLSNCLLTSKPRLLRGLMVLPLQVAFSAAVACLRKREREREMMGGRAI